MIVVEWLVFIYDPDVVLNLTHSVWTTLKDLPHEAVEFAFIKLAFPDLTYAIYVAAHSVW